MDTKGSKKMAKKNPDKRKMKIGFVVNAIGLIKEHDTTLLKIALTAHNRGHELYFLGVGDFSYDGDERVYARAAHINTKKYSSIETYLSELQKLPKSEYKKICVSELDVLLLRNDPSLEGPDSVWARTIALDFGMLATKHGVIVLNNPGGLSKSRNKMYLQHFPEDIRPRTIITRDREEIRRFFDDNEKVVLKPLSGSEGRNVFLVHDKEIPNLNQMIDAVSRDGYVIAQEFLPESENGDIRLFVMNGEPLMKDGKYAAFRRVGQGGDLRNNISKGGVPKSVKVTKDMLRLVDIVRPRLKQDGMFLVGLDIVGDKLLEINVFCPGGFSNIEKITGINFAEPVVDALERKVEYMTYYKRKFDNNEMATM